ncbi:tRNA(Ile2) 2-agmatinylcytidine synthetase [Methanocella sp. CWC-04]|uniref:tRNA(Ile2) 2-agmatinylcytidine synthetase TiaS n=1 Tax=Methanooceanicella nereidis TaxID=2052831 RepID=A0AAP2W658_9EURY|nr:tRNA(Ile)(2)-agmatinylcytidine synthase [Methanocella sp. CWC-04]MCD1294927.1 tRNA(Ile2) 2-agmatinylcytidine synthetase [Methanocella sp. CWC-04]
MLYVGLDDTDSKLGMCTTYLAAILAERLGRFGIEEKLLIRLNPNIKYKTRGNAALCIVLRDEDHIDEVERIVVDAVVEFARMEDENTNPGIVIHRGEIPDEVRDYALRVVRDIVEIDEAVSLAKKYGMRVHQFKIGRGVIGALASIGLDLYDHTYELIAYRMPENCGVPRYLDRDSVYAMDSATYPDTWDNVDLHNKVIVFSPHTPDPVLYGIRGNSPEVLLKAQLMLKTEPVERSIIFKTNQGTDMHLIKAGIADARNNRSYILKGRVSTVPYDIRGGHVFFEIEDEGAVIKCAAFEPTKNFRDIVRKLVPGDIVRVFGSVKDDTVNLEKLEIIELAESFKKMAPVCDVCGRRMESAGAGQGYRCRKCKTKAVAPIYEKVERDLELGLYEVPPTARRHLAKQIIRIEDPWCKMHPSR